MDYYTLLGPAARLLPPETAHNLAIAALKTGLVTTSEYVHPSLESNCFGLYFKNPIGLAAGFDKNAVVTDALFGQGFGFVEAGTVTPLPQPGNSSPRMFRLQEDQAVINRLGFNNAGLHAFVSHTKRRKNSGIFGANIGKNKDSSDAASDYISCFEAVYPYADYITINISSPNTVGLRDLQQKEALRALMQTITAARGTMIKAGGKRKPVLYKIAPDLVPHDISDIIEAALHYAVDGLIVANTTITRPGDLRSRHRDERGGLSGKPLAALALETLRKCYRLSQGRIPLISVGGIGSAEEAYIRIKAGASLVQLYTALIYEGFALVRRINQGVAHLLARDGFDTIKDAVGKE